MFLSCKLSLLVPGINLNACSHYMQSSKRSDQNQPRNSEYTIFFIISGGFVRH